MPPLRARIETGVAEKERWLLCQPHRPDMDYIIWKGAIRRKQNPLQAKTFPISSLAA